MKVEDVRAIANGKSLDRPAGRFHPQKMVDQITDFGRRY